MTTAQDTSSRRRRRRWPVVIVIVVVLIAALIGAFFLADNLARGFAENQVKAAIAQRLPGATAAGTRVEIGGGSFLLQLVRGEFDAVNLHVDDVELEGATAVADVHAEGVHLDVDAPVAHITGTARLSQDAVNALLAANNVDAHVTLGQGAVDYEVQRTVLGIPVGFVVTATPSANGSQLVFTPTSARVSAGSASIDVSDLVTSVVSDSGIALCLASQLPAGVSVDDVKTTPGGAVVSFSANDFVPANVGTKGSC